MFMGNEEVGFAGRGRRVLVFGTTAEMLVLRDLEMRTGAFLPDEPWERGSSVAVLGAGLARELFGAAQPVGELVTLGAWRLRVIGVVGTQGTHFGIDMDESIFVPVTTAMRMFDRTSLFRILLQTRPGFSVDSVVERASELLRARHGEEDFTVTTPDAILSALDAILAVLTLVLVGIAAISLGVAGIGTMNVMLVSVAERTPEVGLLEALGASRRQILALFLTEAALLSAAGGLVGLAVGWLVLRVAEVPPLWAAAAAFGLALAVGTLFGFWPALRATRLDPVAALAGRVR
jgi:putative ABC transport system permease protein